jgi:thymidylate synthase
VNEQLQRTPQELPTLNIVKDFSSLEEALDLVVSDFQLDNYNPLSVIKAKMAI